MIRAVAVTASALVRAGLESLVEVAGVAATLPEAIAIAVDAAADLIVIDLSDAANDTERPELNESPVPVLLLVPEPQPPWMREALQSGVRGIVPFDLSSDELLAAIQAVAAGLVVVHPQGIQEAIAVAAASISSAEHLTRREIDVLRLLSEGASNKIIAWKLSISEHTVKFHVNSILSKMHAGSRTEAVMLGVRRGLIPL